MKKYVSLLVATIFALSLAVMSCNKKADEPVKDDTKVEKKEDGDKKADDMKEEKKADDKKEDKK